MSQPVQKPKSLQARIVSGSFILLSGSGLATVINFLYNIAVARFLGPDGFGDATVVYTLLTLLSAVTLSFQIVSAKVVAQQSSPQAKYAGYRGFHRGSWVCGIVCALALVILRVPISRYLNLPGTMLVLLLAVGVAFYVPLGSRRGYLQGAFGFRRLATSLVLEGAVRLTGSLLMIFLGLGVRGVIAANSAAVAVAYLAIIPERAGEAARPVHFPRAMRETLQAMVFFSGQMIINNCDIVLVKHFFLPDPAGLYAAVAMVGRVVFSLSSAVVNSMFPLVAGTRDEERKDLTVIATSLLLVLGIGSFLALALRLAPSRIWTMFFGAKFQIAGDHGLPYLLALYAITTVVYSLSAVIITYEMSYKIANTSWIQLAFSGVVIAGICRFHSSLREVILVQLVLMAGLLLCIALPFFFDLVMQSSREVVACSFGPARLIRRVSEEAVIAEFLKSDFGNSAFQPYQQSLAPLVQHPDLDNAHENAMRRALFFLRHRALWNELPSDTEWYQMEVTRADCERIRVFPRGQWRRLARNSFSAANVVESIRTREHTVDGRLLTKISEIRDRLATDDPDLGAVILIGSGENDPLTVIDGNHRLVAAMLSDDGALTRLRFLCGLSPRMGECCWYNTNFVTLLRYSRNVLRHAIRRPKTELARMLEVSG